MSVVSIRIPQLGEGLREALLVEFLKTTGDRINRDEPLFTMETDKATTDIESPYAGELIEWLVEIDSVLEIGTEIARVRIDATESSQSVDSAPAGHGHLPSRISDSDFQRSAIEHSGGASQNRQPPSGSASSALIAPKTRRFLVDHGLLDVAHQIEATGKKLSIADVRVYLANQRPTSDADTAGPAFDVVPLPKSQVKLNYRLTRAATNCVPVTLVSDWVWDRIAAARNAVRESRGPTAFAMLCWCIVQAAKKHDRFRSALIDDGRSFKVFRNVNLGIAVALEGDELATAVVRHAEQMSAAEFFEAYQASVAQARQGMDQADESTTLLVSNIGNMGMKVGIPAIVAPAVATLAIGQAVDQPFPLGDSFVFKKMITATLSFDHRIANGAGAAAFLNQIKSHVESFELNALD